MSHIFLLTGWGVGKQCLTTLAEELTRFQHQVVLQDLPYDTETNGWLAKLEQQLPINSYWVGWSLGGQLLSQMTSFKANQCQGLVTLATNISFTVKEDWPYAMEKDMFNQFVQNYKYSPKKTTKRFLQLIAQGSRDYKAVVRTLQQSITENNLTAGLTWLAQLDTRLALMKFTKPQYHLLATEDVLVPKSCVKNITQCLPQAEVTMLDGLGHAFVIEEPALVANKINQFIRQSNATQ